METTEYIESLKKVLKEVQRDLLVKENTIASQRLVLSHTERELNKLEDLEADTLEIIRRELNKLSRAVMYYDEVRGDYLVREGNHYALFIEPQTAKRCATLLNKEGLLLSQCEYVYGTAHDYKIDVDNLVELK